MKPSNRFTILEIIIVILILGILALIAVPRVHAGAAGKAPAAQLAEADPATSPPGTVPTPPTGIVDLGNQAGAILAAADQSSNLYQPDELEFATGAVWQQNNNEAGALFRVTKWDVFRPGIGIGGEVIENSSTKGTAAAFAFAEYRKTYGNVAGGIFLGGGYDVENSQPMGTAGGRVYYRWNKHLGSWIGAGYALEQANTRRGLVTGGGLSYSF